MEDQDRTRPSSESEGDSLQAVRGAVERTLAATAGSAGEAGRRARELLDEVARRGADAREGLARRGGAAREQVSRRGQAAREEVERRRREAGRELSRRGTDAREELARRGEAAGNRLADAITELRTADRGDLGPISEPIDAIEGRLEELERALRGGGSEAEPQPETEGEHDSPRSQGGSDG